MQRRVYRFLRNRSKSSIGVPVASRVAQREPGGVLISKHDTILVAVRNAVGTIRTLEGAKTLGEGGLSLSGEILRRKDKQTVLIKSFLHISP